MTRSKLIIYIAVISFVSLICLASIVFVIFSTFVPGQSTVRTTENPISSGLVFPTGTYLSGVHSTSTVEPTISTVLSPTANSEIETKQVTTLMPGPTGRIVFTCQVTKDSRYNQICIMDADGRNFQRLTFEVQYDHNFPSLAPDGSGVVFSSNQSGGYEIYSQDWTGTQVQLTNEQLTGDFGAFAPEFSPDGEWIVYAIINSDSEKSIYIMDRFGSQRRWLFGSKNAGAWDPSWSPDGARILFMSDRTGSNQLHTISLDGEDIRQITDLQELRGRNDWSPDGSVIATYIGTTWEREIILMNSDGSNPRYLTDGGNNLAPSFSPDGHWVAFTSYMDLYRNNNGCEIYILRLDGSEMRRLTNNDYCDWQPRWGP